MTMLTLVGPQVAQSLQLTFSFKCEAFQVHQNPGGRSVFSSLLTFICKSATLQAINRFWEGVASAPSCP